MITYKIKYNEYIASLYIPEKLSGKRVVLLPGLPISQDITNILAPFFEAGCVVFYPYFSGSFDSAGSFDAKKCMDDLVSFLEMANQGSVTELYFGKEIEFGENKGVILAGMSYGASIAALGPISGYEKLILLSPVFLYSQKDISSIMPFDFKSQMDNLIHLIVNAYPFTYRLLSSESMQKFLSGELPSLAKEKIIQHLENISIKTLILYGEKDTSIPYQISEYLRMSVSNKNLEWKLTQAGHSTSSYGEETLILIKNFLLS